MRPQVQAGRTRQECAAAEGHGPSQCVVAADNQVCTLKGKGTGVRAVVARQHQGAVSSPRNQGKAGAGPCQAPEKVVPAGLERVRVLAPLRVTAPLKVNGVLPPRVTTPFVPPALERVTVLVTVVGMLAWTVPLKRARLPVPNPDGFPILRVPDSSVVVPV